MTLEPYELSLSTDEAARILAEFIDEHLLDSKTDCAMKMALKLLNSDGIIKRKTIKGE